MVEQLTPTTYLISHGQDLGKVSKTEINWPALCKRLTRHDTAAIVDSATAKTEAALHRDLFHVRLHPFSLARRGNKIDTEIDGRTTRLDPARYIDA